MMNRPHRFTVYDEALLPEPYRHAIGRLLTDTFTCPDARERGWNKVKPDFFVVALSPEGQLLGSCMTCWVPCAPALRVAGFGDMAVYPAHRGLGLARAMADVLWREALSRGAVLGLARTAPMRKVCAQFGFTVPGPRVWLADGREENNWMWSAAPGFQLPAELVVNELF